MLEKEVYNFGKMIEEGCRQFFIYLAIVVTVVALIVLALMIILSVVVGALTHQPILGILTFFIQAFGIWFVFFREQKTPVKPPTPPTNPELPSTIPTE